MPGTVINLSVSLFSITHAHPKDIDVMLVGPGGQKAMIMSDAGGYSAISGINLTLDDRALVYGAARVLPNGGPLSSGTYRPSNYADCDDPGGSDTFPAPAPAPAVNSALSTFNGTNANGTWSLYVVDDAGGNTGSISGGWAMTINTTCPLPSPTSTPRPGPSPSVFTFTAPTSVTAGSPFTFTVTARSQFGSPINYSGTIHFTSSDPSAALPPDSGLSGGSTGTFTATLNQPSTGQTITATSTSNQFLSNTSNCISVSPPPSPTPLVHISGNVSYCSNPTPGPVPNVTLTLTGSASASTLTDGSGNYAFSSLAAGGNYTVTPAKSALSPGAAGITTVDVIAVQRQFLGFGILSGCRLTAADVNGDASVSTVDVIAVQRFFLGVAGGTTNVGKYQFNPASRSYPGLASDQTNQNYDTIIFGDVGPPFVVP